MELRRFRRRPVDQLLVQGTWGTGFRAPSLVDLYCPASESVAEVVDTQRCNETGDSNVDRNILRPTHPCQVIGVAVLNGGNSELDAEESVAWTLGLVCNPVADLSIGLDCYDIDFDGEVSSLGAQSILDDEARYPGSDHARRFGLQFPGQCRHRGRQRTRLAM